MSRRWTCLLVSGILGAALAPHSYGVEPLAIAPPRKPTALRLPADQPIIGIVAPAYLAAIAPIHGIERFSVPSHTTCLLTRKNQWRAYRKVEQTAVVYPEVAKRTRLVAKQYHAAYESLLAERIVVLHGYNGQSGYSQFYARYCNRGFYGGYSYPVRSSDDIAKYFDYPMVSWLYVTTPETDFYRSFYANAPDATPLKPFSRPGVYYPTDTIRDLAMDVSGMDDWAQVQFRSAMELITTQLENRVNELVGGSFAFAANDIAITHYRNLKNKALVMEGFIDRTIDKKQSIHLSFKTFLDLSDGERSTLFMPSRDRDPSQADLALLKKFNEPLVSLGCDPAVEIEEPYPNPLPEPKTKVAPSANPVFPAGLK